MGEDNERSMTYGEEMVGLTFNPSGNEEVNDIKKSYAKLIDNLHNSLHEAKSDMQRHFYAMAIDRALDAQMWAVKAATWDK